MGERRWNSHMHNPCESCRGWGFHAGFKDPDTDFDCDECGGRGSRRPEGEKR